MTSRLDMNGWKPIWHLYMVPKVKPQTGRPTKARNKKKKMIVTSSKILPEWVRKV